jgi:molybdopterin-binding protein
VIARVAYVGQHPIERVSVELATPHRNDRAEAAIKSTTTRGFNDVHLAAPEVLDWLDIDGLRFSTQPNDQESDPDPRISEYRPGQVAELLGVSVDTVRRWCDEGRLATTRSDGGHRVIAGSDLAVYLREHAPAAEADAPVVRSARNRFTGIVLEVKRDTLTAVIDIQAGPHRVVSLMTREAADELALEPGDIATAVVKATTVIVEANS